MKKALKNAGKYLLAVLILNLIYWFCEEILQGTERGVTIAILSFIVIDQYKLIK